MEEPCGICGGGALNIGLIEALEHELNVQLLVTPQPQMTAALGAALLARMQVHGPA
jgi:activator of 2-hydroxyglutaryl-CoA dehydratase